jgi:16S rRNA (cytidine1402-2'-O)-methyltransferase
MPGTLYVVATPIGNLEDLTFRAARILGQVGLIAAEDTRQTRKLLTHLGLKTRMVSYNQHNARLRAPRLLEALVKSDVALVTDAGAPGVSDPGPGLAASASDAGFQVVTVPGPSAVTAAVAVSGFPADAFHFLGFLPRGRKARRASLERSAYLPATLVLFESPHRLVALLEDMLAVLGDRQLAVCRELTKLHEEIFRGAVSEAIEHFVVARGEFTIVVTGVIGLPSAPGVSDEDLRAAIEQLRGRGMSVRDGSTLVAQELGVARRRVYALWTTL